MFNLEPSNAAPALISPVKETTVEWDGLYALEYSSQKLGIQRPHVFSIELPDGYEDIRDTLEPYRVAEFGHFLLSNTERVLSFLAMDYQNRDDLNLRLRQFARLAGEWCVACGDDDNPLRVVCLPEREIDITQEHPLGTKVMSPAGNNVINLGAFRASRIHS